MKPQILKKAQNKIRPDEIFYTYSHWEPRFIDGKKFIPVVKQRPNHSVTQTVNYMNEDQLKLTICR